MGTHDDRSKTFLTTKKSLAAIRRIARTASSRSNFPSVEFGAITLDGDYGVTSTHDTLSSESKSTFRKEHTVKNMSPEEYRAFMMDTARTGKLATVRADGRPHVAPIWFTMDGEDLIFNTWHTSVKAKNLLHDNRASLCVDVDTPPFAYAIIEGTVEIQTAPDHEELLHWATEIAGRYMGEEQAKAFGERNAVEGEYLLRLKPTKVIAKTNISD